MRPPRGWVNLSRSADYYDEGDLLWLEVATIIHQQTNGQKEMDDFCHLFHGGQNDGPQVKTYTLERVVDALKSVAPYDWAGFFKTRLNSVSPDAPTGGIENGGWKVTYSAEPPKMPGRRGESIGDDYSVGLTLGNDGAVNASIYGSPAWQAGIGPGMKVAGVDGRVYTHDGLQDALKTGKPVELLVIVDDYYKTFTVDYSGGPKYPHLVRQDGKADVLDELIKARTGQ